MNEVRRRSGRRDAGQVERAARQHPGDKGDDRHDEAEHSEIPHAPDSIEQQIIAALVEYRDATDAAMEANQRHRDARARLVAVFEAAGLRGYVP